MPVQRYEWPTPGDLLHVDIKPLGRIDGVGHRIRRPAPGARGQWMGYVHVASMITAGAYVEVLTDPATK